MVPWYHWYIHVHTYIHTYIHTHTYTHTHSHTHTFIYNVHSAYGDVVHTTYGMRALNVPGARALRNPRAPQRAGTSGIYPYILIYIYGWIGSAVFWRARPPNGSLGVDLAYIYIYTPNHSPEGPSFRVYIYTRNGGIFWEFHDFHQNREAENLIL